MPLSMRETSMRWSLHMSSRCDRRRMCATNCMLFVSENAVEVARTGTQESIDYMRHIDIVRAAIYRMTVTARHRQSNITAFNRALDPLTARQGMIDDSE